MITFKSGITEKHAVENSTAPSPHFGQTHEPKLWERAGSDSDAQIGKHAHRWLPFAPPDAAPILVCPDGGRHLEPPPCPAAAGPAKRHSATALPRPESTVWSECPSLLSHFLHVFLLGQRSLQDRHKWISLDETFIPLLYSDVLLSSVLVWRWPVGPDLLLQREHTHHCNRCLCYQWCAACQGH